jgi:hypothetical protein
MLLLGVNLALLDGRDVGVYSDIPIESHGKILKTKYYKSQRQALWGVRGDGTVTVLQEDNLYISLVANGYDNTKDLEYP